MGKTKAQLEQEIRELKKRLGDAQDAPEGSPGRSEVRPDGAVVVGATLHIDTRLPPLPPVPAATGGELTNLAYWNEGETYNFGQVRALPLYDGGWAVCQEVKVVHQSDDGRTVVEVVR